MAMHFVFTVDLFYKLFFRPIVYGFDFLESVRMSRKALKNTLKLQFIYLYTHHA